MKRRLMAAAVMVIGTTLSGCAVRGGYVATGYGPPPPRYGIVGVAPGPGYVWTDGYWDRRGNGWYWMSGRWMRPPRPHSVWVPGYWSRHGHGYRFHDGHWR